MALTVNQLIKKLEEIDNKHAEVEVLISSTWEFQETVSVRKHEKKVIIYTERIKRK